MCNHCVPAIDPAAAEVFGQKMLEVLNGGALSLMISLGHRTGLFDTMHGQAPATSSGIAERAGLNERYVREWLGAMVTGGIVLYDAPTRMYRLPAEHGEFLARNGASHMAGSLQFFAVLAGVEDRIVDCFREGGGVHYAEFPRFHEVMAEESAVTVAGALEEFVLPLEPGLIEQLEGGMDVLDVGCGSGLAMITLAERFPASRFLGIDFSEEAIGRAQAEADRRGLSNVAFEIGDAARIDRPAQFDLVTAFDAIHDQRDPAAVLRQIREALRSGGLFLMQDIAASSQLENNMERPMAPFLFTISTMHCMTVSLAAGGAGLGTCWGEELALQMLGEAGFGQSRMESLPHDIMNSWYLSRAV